MENSTGSGVGLAPSLEGPRAPTPPVQHPRHLTVTSFPPAPPLSCTVRDCGLLLERRGQVLICARGHAYDVARSGYFNLLQPQDRKSLSAGDTSAAIEARARLLGTGLGRSILDAFVSHAAALMPSNGVVVDLGSGSGEVLGELAQRVSGAGIGIDLSTAAAEYAARRFPAITWIVANADRRLPLLDHTVDLVLSLNGRRHPAEAARVMTRAGHLLVATPAADDLIELRAAVQGQRMARERHPALVAEHAAHFEVVEQFEARERHHVTREQMRDLLRGTYRGTRHSAVEAVEALDDMDVTLASTILLLRRSGNRHRESTVPAVREF
jgi:23S rRNA (guanine745-N1)-methyltransferase